MALALHCVCEPRTRLYHRVELIRYALTSLTTRVVRPASVARARRLASSSRYTAWKTPLYALYTPYCLLELLHFFGAGLRSAHSPPWRHRRGLRQEDNQNSIVLADEFQASLALKRTSRLRAPCRHPIAQFGLISINRRAVVALMLDLQQRSKEENATATHLTNVAGYNFSRSGRRTFA